MIKEVPTIAKNWWLFVVLGVVCIAAGIAVIVWPDITLLTLGLLMKEGLDVQVLVYDIATSLPPEQ